MEKKHTFNKIIALLIIFILFISSSTILNATTSVPQTCEDNVQTTYTPTQYKEKPSQTIPITIQTIGLPGKQQQQIHLTLEQTEHLLQQLHQLQHTITTDPMSSTIPLLQKQLIQILQQHHIIPNNQQTNRIHTYLQKHQPMKSDLNSPITENHATAWFCNFLTTGEGSAFPIIILPRLVPFILTPIPRLFVRWKTNAGITSCGSLTSGKGFIATGMQDGFALGFWGIGFSIFIPPFYTYGLFGYALYASANAEHIEPWPPNEPPVVSNENPPHGAWNIPLTTNELSFDIYDGNNEPMTYTVTTNPDIGSKSQTNVESGTYTIPIQDLTYNTRYTWTITVTDGITDTIEEYSFYTEEKPFDPFQEGWQYRKQITIDHTKVSGELTNFPILISTIDADLRDKAHPDGDDILFMNGPGTATRLYHEIEHYDNTTGELIAWVNIPTLSSIQDTTFLMYYDNSNCENQQFSERVWNSDYLTVLHMKDYPDAAHIADSTLFSNDGTKKASNEPMEIDGKIKNGQSFDGSDDYIDTKDFDINNDFTLSLWIKPSSTSYNHAFIGKHSTYDTNLILCGYYERDGLNGFSLRIQDDVHRGGTITSDWQYLVYTAEETQDSQTQASFYCNGLLIWSETLADIAGNVMGKPWTIGQDWDSGGRTDFYYGIIDEIRISNSMKEIDWIATEYNSQNSPNTFYSFGPEESSP